MEKIDDILDDDKLNEANKKGENKEQVKNNCNLHTGIYSRILYK